MTYTFLNPAKRHVSLTVAPPHEITTGVVPFNKPRSQMNARAMPITGQVAFWRYVARSNKSMESRNDLWLSLRAHHPYSRENEAHYAYVARPTVVRSFGALV